MGNAGDWFQFYTTLFCSCLLGIAVVGHWECRGVGSTSSVSAGDAEFPGVSKALSWMLKGVIAIPWKVLGSEKCGYHCPLASLTMLLRDQVQPPGWKC